jgi:hypothetical protein
MDVATCFTKDCDKPRFREYYVCVEHFVFYAAPRYTESLLVKAEKFEPAAYPEISLDAEAPTGDDGQLESPAAEPAEQLDHKAHRKSFRT